MNILVLGNGFDLAHGLPTKYSDFLDFVEVIRQFIDAGDRTFGKGEWNNLHPEIVELIKQNALLREKEWRALLEENFWIDYFLQCPMYNKENWIDFESEICNVVKSLDKDMVAEDGSKYLFEEEIMTNLSNDYLDVYFKEHLFVGQYDDKGNPCGELSYKAIRNTLYRDLNKLTRALEIYLAEYVGKMECNVVSPDIRKVWFDSVLSFNYTDTYGRKYDPNILAEYDYIHGQAELSRTVDSNNMVLGIDEYLPKERKNKEVEFIAFKKFYQRIYKETGCKYKDWVDEIHSGKKIMNRVYAGIEENGNRIFESIAASYHNLYIFGHSLDVTDGDILRDLILNDNVHTTIFYYNKDVMGQQIANLVKVIGQDELIRRTGGSAKTIEFKQQADMVERV